MKFRIKVYLLICQIKIRVMTILPEHFQIPTAWFNKYLSLWSLPFSHRHTRFSRFSIPIAIQEGEVQMEQSSWSMLSLVRPTLMLITFRHKLVKGSTKSFNCTRVRVFLTPNPGPLSRAFHDMISWEKSFET